MSNIDYSQFGFSIKRLKTLNDALVAVVIALLIYNIQAPFFLSHLNNEDLLHALHKMLPSFFAYAICFLAIARYWQLHNLLFRNVPVLGKRLLWLNIFYLLTITFLPFPTQLFGKLHVQMAVIIFDIGISLPAFLLCLMAVNVIQVYVVGSVGIVSHSHKETAIKLMLRILSIPWIAFISFAISFESIATAKWVWALILLTTFI